MSRILHSICRQYSVFKNKVYEYSTHTVLLNVLYYRHICSWIRLCVVHCIEYLPLKMRTTTRTCVRGLFVRAYQS